MKDYDKLILREIIIITIIIVFGGGLLCRYISKTMLNSNKPSKNVVEESIDDKGSSKSESVSVITPTEVSATEVSSEPEYSETIQSEIVQSEANQSGTEQSEVTQPEVVLDIDPLTSKEIDIGSLASSGVDSPIDVTGYTCIHDSLETEDQVNTYTFTPPIDGEYGFCFTDVRKGDYLNLYIIDNLGYSHDYYEMHNNSSGIVEMEAGQTYEIKVKQKHGLDPYTLNIGYQKETVDISDYTVVNDSLEFDYQVNRYIYNKTTSDDVSFTVSGIRNNTKINVYVYDELDYCIKRYPDVWNGHTFTWDDVPIGTYEIIVKQSKGYSPYTLSIK